MLRIEDTDQERLVEGASISSTARCRRPALFTTRDRIRTAGTDPMYRVSVRLPAST